MSRIETEFVHKNGQFDLQLTKIEVANSNNFWEYLYGTSIDYSLKECLAKDHNVPLKIVLKIPETYLLNRDGKTVIVKGEMIEVTSFKEEYENRLPRIRREIAYERKIQGLMDLVKSMCEKEMQDEGDLNVLLEEYHKVVEEGVLKFKDIAQEKRVQLQQLGLYIAGFAGAKRDDEEAYACALEQRLK